MKVSTFSAVLIFVSIVTMARGQWKDTYEYTGHREKFSGKQIINFILTDKQKKANLINCFPGNCLRHLESALMRREDASVHVPLCDEHGRYKKRQCHPRDGFCWCVDQYGDMIGEKFRNRRFRCDNVVYNGS